MTSVTREDAIKFLEGACRNWPKVPKLSEDDIGDVASELLRFALAAEQREREECAQLANNALYSPVSDGESVDTRPEAAYYMAEKIMKAIRNRTGAPS